MKTEDLVLDHCSQRKHIKEISEVFPNISITVLAKTLIIETVNLCNLPAFVVSSQNGDPILETDFQADK